MTGSRKCESGALFLFVTGGTVLSSVAPKKKKLCVCVCVLLCVGPRFGCSLENSPPQDRQSTGRPKNSLFFPSPATIFNLSSSLGVLSWNFGGVFEARKFHEKTSKREKKERQLWRGEGEKKKREILGPPPSAPHPSGPHPSALHPSGPHFCPPRKTGGWRGGWGDFGLSRTNICEIFLAQVE